MALGLIHSVMMDFFAQEGTASQTFPFPLPKKTKVFVFCYLTQVNSPGGFGGFGNAQVLIQDYRQNGTTVTVNTQVINESNVDHVTFTVTASDAWVQAVGVIFDQDA